MCRRINEAKSHVKITEFVNLVIPIKLKGRQIPVYLQEPVEIELTKHSLESSDK